MATVRIYMRCSTADQDTDSQKDGLSRWASNYAPLAPQEWYSETVSGDAKVRPELERMKREMNRGDIVLCWALDRLSRSGIVPLCTEIENFGKMGVRLVSIKEPWADSDNPVSEVVIAVMAWAAQQEKKRLKERQAAGIKAAKDKGKKWGGRKPGERYKRTDEIDSAVRLLKKQGTPIYSIAKMMKLGRETIYRILRESPQTKPTDHI